MGRGRGGKWKRTGRKQGREGKREGRRSVPANKNLRLHPWSQSQHAATSLSDIPCRRSPSAWPAHLETHVQVLDSATTHRHCVDYGRTRPGAWLCNYALTLCGLWENGMLIETTHDTRHPLMEVFYPSQLKSCQPSRIYQDVLYFRVCVPCPSLGVPGTQNVPYFRGPRESRDFQLWLDSDSCWIPVRNLSVWVDNLQLTSMWLWCCVTIAFIWSV